MSKHNKTASSSALSQTFDTIMLEQVEITSYDHLVKVITGQLMRLFEPVSCTFSTYDPGKNALQVLDIKAGSGVLDLALKLGALSFLRKPVPVDERIYTQMTQERISTCSTLHEATNGVIPQQVSAAVGKAFQISCYLGISFVLDNEVFGTSALALKAVPAPPLIDLLKTYVTFTSITIKRLLTEQRLRENAVLLDSSLAIIASCDLDGRLTYVNPAFMNHLGFDSPDEVLGRQFTEFWMVQDQSEEIMAALLGNVGPRRWSGEIKGKRKDGSLFDIHVSATTVLDASGKPISLMSTSIDITERKQAEEALRESEERLRLMTRNIKDSVIETDANGYCTYVSPSAPSVIGRGQEMLGQRIFDFLHPENLEHTILAIAEAGLNKTTTRAEYRFLHPEKGYIWVEATGGTYQNSLNDTMVLMTSRDITDRKQAEEALKASEEKHREILAAIEEGYYEVDLAGNMVFCNESFCRITGYSSDELMGKNYKQFYINLEEVFNAFNRVYQTEKSVTAVDWPAITKDGRKIQLEFSISLRRDEKGEPSGFRGVVRDITARRQADEKIRYLSYHDQLTGLYNRHFLEEEMARLDTERQLPIGIIMADLNGLKLANDTFGHQSGDEMLKCAAEILKSVCREEDILARFGGDEFLLYLPRTSEKEARKISERIEQACRSHPSIHHCCDLIQDVPLSLSMGLAFKTSAEQKLSDLLREAEDSMYREKLTESRSGKSAIVNSLLHTLAAKSFETEAHTRNMQETAKSLGEKLGLPHSEMHRLSLLITLHDIGKINIPEELLTKKGPLSGPEWEIMKKHCETGYRVAKATESFAHVAEDILAHHERWDGSGYPQGLKGDKIPLLARVTAIADAYEVMSHGRPYKEAMSKSEITAELKNSSGTQFDPQLVELFLSVLEESS